MFTGSKLRLRVASSAILLNLLVDMKVDPTDTSSAQQILTGTVVLCSPTDYSLVWDMFLTILVGVYFSMMPNDGLCMIQITSGHQTVM